MTINKQVLDGPAGADSRGVVPSTIAERLRRTFRQMGGAKGTGSSAKRSETVITRETGGRSSAAPLPAESLIGEYVPSMEVMFPVGEALHVPRKGGGLSPQVLAVRKSAQGCFGAQEGTLSLCTVPCQVAQEQGVAGRGFRIVGPETEVTAQHV